MRILFSLILTISTSEAVVERLNATVSRMTAEEYYIRVKERDSNSEKKRENLDPGTKHRICLSIMGSSEYARHEGDPVDMYEVPKKLLKRYPEMFGKFYVSSDDTRTYINPTKSMDVYIPKTEEPFKENVFVCICHWYWEDKKKAPFFEYFISEEYNVGPSDDHYIAARFVFYHDSYDNDRGKVDGIAEEPARALLGLNWSRSAMALFTTYIMEQGNIFGNMYLNVERLYLLRKRENEAAYNDSEDPMCQLSEDQRFRLCGLIFNSEYFDGKVEVPASYTMIGDSKCHWNAVSFRRNDVLADASENQYKEWMIVCYMSGLPFDYHTEYKNVYYLSRAYSDSNNASSSNDVFVYRHGESDSYYKKHYYLVNVFTNIRL